MTNRELYLLTVKLEAQYSVRNLSPLEKCVHPLKRLLLDSNFPRAISLEEYLRSLWFVVSNSKIAEPTVENVADWLETAFTIAPPDFDSRWLSLRPAKGLVENFTDWENVILYQIADLRRMAESGQLQDKERYFGIDSPSGSRWYNFDPFSYLECGVRGAFGGYEADEVIVLHQPPNGESADSEVFEITDFSWQEFASILRNGQWYE